MVMLYHMPICFVNSLEAESWLNWSVPPVPGGVLQDATGPGFREVRTYGIDADALAAQVVRGEQPFGFNLPYLQLGYMPQTPPPLEAPE